MHEQYVLLGEARATARYHTSTRADQQTIHRYHRAWVHYERGARSTSTWSRVATRRGAAEALAGLAWELGEELREHGEGSHDAGVIEARIRMLMAAINELSAS